jgi:predicted RNA methylase
VRGCQVLPGGVQGASSSQVDLVVTNPPWGKNIGSSEDTFAIVHNVMACFPHATAGFLMSEVTHKQLLVIQARQAAEGLPPSLQILQSIKCARSVFVLVRKAGGMGINADR